MLRAGPLCVPDVKVGDNVAIGVQTLFHQPSLGHRAPKPGLWTAPVLGSGRARQSDEQEGDFQLLSCSGAFGLFGLTSDERPVGSWYSVGCPWLPTCVCVASDLQSLTIPRPQFP